jgi:hypothetical protein
LKANSASAAKISSRAIAQAADLEGLGVDLADQIEVDEAVVHRRDQRIGLRRRVAGESVVAARRVEHHEVRALAELGHALLERVGGAWTVEDRGSSNGTSVNASRINGPTVLRDGDVLRIGRTTLGYRRPDAEDSAEHTVVAGEPVALADIPQTQRQVLVALARPYKQSEFPTPATNQEIAAELHLSVDAVKAHLRSLFQRFGLEQLPQNQKRSRLVAEAFQRGVLSQRDL